MAIYTILDTGDSVTNMTNAQARLDTMVAGDTLKLAANVYFHGTLVLPAKAANVARIFITSDADPTNLPASGARVDPTLHARYMPKIQTLVNNEPCLRTCLPGDGVANGYTISCIEFIANAFGGGNLVEFGNADTLLSVKQDTVAKVPGFLTLDRCYVHGLPAAVAAPTNVDLI